MKVNEGGPWDSEHPPLGV